MRYIDAKDLLAAVKQRDEAVLISALTSREPRDLQSLAWVMKSRLPRERASFPLLLDHVGRDVALQAIRRAAGLEPADDPVALLTLPSTMQPELVPQSFEWLWEQDRDGYSMALRLVLTEHLELSEEWAIACSQLFRHWWDHQPWVDQWRRREINTAFYRGISCDVEVVEAARSQLYELTRNQETASVAYLAHLTGRVEGTTDPILLDEYADHRNWQVRVAVAVNPAAARSTVDRLSEDPSSAVVQAVATREDLGHDGLLTLLETAGSSEAAVVLRNSAFDAAAAVDLLRERLRALQQGAGAAKFASALLEREDVPLDLAEDAIEVSLQSRRPGSRGAAADVRRFLLHADVTAEAVVDLVPFLGHAAPAEAAIDTAGQRFGEDALTPLLESMVMNGSAAARQVAVNDTRCPEEYRAIGALL